MHVVTVPALETQSLSPVVVGAVGIEESSEKLQTGLDIKRRWHKGQADEKGYCSTLNEANPQSFMVSGGRWVYREFKDVLLPKRHGVSGV
jgi:hypothetical protein